MLPCHRRARTVVGSRSSIRIDAITQLWARLGFDDAITGSAFFHLVLARLSPGKARFNRLNFDIIGSASLFSADEGGPNVTEPWPSADHIGSIDETIYTWTAEKCMSAHKNGRLWKMHATEIDDWVRRGGAAGPKTVLTDPCDTLPSTRI